MKKKGFSFFVGLSQLSIEGTRNCCQLTTLTPMDLQEPMMDLQRLFKGIRARWGSVCLSFAIS